MTRKYFILFIIIWIFISIMLIYIIGDTGLIAQNSKKALLNEKKIALNASKAHLQLLENKEFNSSQLDTAFKLGYIQKGDEVYFFEKNSKIHIEDVNTTNKEIYKGWNKYLLILISFIITVFLFLIKAIISHIVFKKNHKEDNQEEIEKNIDYREEYNEFETYEKYDD